MTVPNLGIQPQVDNGGVVRRVVVVGGGIGGLTAAISLRAAGCHVVVVEKAEQFGDVGAGVQLGPNATKILGRLGLADAVREASVIPDSVRLLRWQDDQVLSEWELGAAAVDRFGAPYVTMYRPDLIDLLAGRLPADTVKLGAAVTEVHAAAGHRPWVRMTDGTTQDADLLVGSDGTHSIMRDSTVGPVPARFSGMSAYRALIPSDAAGPEFATTVHNWLGPDRHLVAYPVGRDARYVNLVCVVPEQDWSTESWTAPGSPNELRAHFQAWSPKARALLEAVTDPVYRWALYDREPLTTWSTASTTLLGDACHPMLPFMAQGAAQAIEDAAALAACLQTSNLEIAAALNLYERARRPHTTRIQRLSWENNYSYHLADGPAQRKRDSALADGNGAMRLESLAWVFANDAEHIVA